MNDSNPHKPAASGAVIGPWRGFYWWAEGPGRSSEEPVPGSFLVLDFALRRTATWWVPETLRKLESLPLLESSIASIDTPADLEIDWRLPSAANFSARVEQAMDRFAHSALRKVVPCEFETTTWRPLEKDLTRLLNRAGDVGQGQWLYGWWNADEGMIGQSPEILFEVSDGILRTMALAGSCEPGRPDADFLADKKENEEHEWVVRDLVEALAPFGQVHVGPRTVLHLPRLKHLKTEIECRQLGPASPFALLRALHPSAALGGFPRAEARAWLAAQPEYHERDTFGAPLVFFADPQNFLAVVCIRGLQWNRQGSRIGAGCGLVARSQWEQEWRELFLKRQSVKAALGL